MVRATSFIVAGRPSCGSWKGGDGGGKKNRDRKESGKKCLKEVRIHSQVAHYPTPQIEPPQAPQPGYDPKRIFFV